MAFKHHSYGNQSNRAVEEDFEAAFHQKLVAALNECTRKGDRKRQGYIMGAFRDVLSEFNVNIERKETT